MSKTINSGFESTEPGHFRSNFHKNDAMHEGREERNSRIPQRTDVAKQPRIPELKYYQLNIRRKQGFEPHNFQHFLQHPEQTGTHQPVGQKDQHATGHCQHH